ncbi:hypothetical protein P5X00_37060 [Paraburkholderia sp. A2RO-4L]|jgi:hypothetical protein|uniref:hypothetical protein n=2 Tax=unclassified Paraburkholderia TaxID=2615204 RepID=UPI0032F7DB25|nr:hypothetical protein [Burkholderia vietnamiensis]
MMMSRIDFSASVAAGNDSAGTARQPAPVNRVLLKAMTFAAALAVSASVLAAAKPVAKQVTPAVAASAVKIANTPAATHPSSQKDPFAGDTWHAMQGTWPGTIVFESGTNEVTLSPVGAAPMKATYTYTVKPSSSDKVVEGTLRMTNTAKQVSNSTFHIEGKNLTLVYEGDAHPEHYVRMTPKEEEAEIARLQKMVSEGRVRPLK